jgi:uncharacterized Zn-binding protein involved in type VI secretion
MAGISRQGDANQEGGKIIRGAGTVFANGKPVGLHTSQITAHAPWPRRKYNPHPPHAAATTTSASDSVFAEGSQVLKIGSGNSCGHSIVEGSSDVNVP